MAAVAVVAAVGLTKVMRMGYPVSRVVRRCLDRRMAD
jgi:hypothetical protein